MSASKSEREEHMEYVHKTLSSIREQFGKLDGRIRVVKISGQLYVENAERYMVYPQVNRMMREIEKLNAFLEKYSEEEILDMIFERYEM